MSALGGGQHLWDETGGAVISRVALRLPINNTLPPPEPFPFNPDALQALEEAREAEYAANIETISCTAVGAPGSADKLRRMAELLREAAIIIREVADDPAEMKRFDHWANVYDDPFRPDTFNKSPY